MIVCKLVLVASFVLSKRLRAWNHGLERSINDYQLSTINILPFEGVRHEDCIESVRRDGCNQQKALDLYKGRAYVQSTLKIGHKLIIVFRRGRCIERAASKH